MRARAREEHSIASHNLTCTTPYQASAHVESGLRDETARLNQLAQDAAVAAAEAAVAAVEREKSAAGAVGAKSIA